MSGFAVVSPNKQVFGMNVFREQGDIGFRLAAPRTSTENGQQSYRLAEKESRRVFLGEQLPAWGRHV